MDARSRERNKIIKPFFPSCIEEEQGGLIRRFVWGRKRCKNLGFVSLGSGGTLPTAGTQVR